MKHQIGNYMYSYPLMHRRVGSTKYIIGIADAYNAFGLIGPEHNGIFILNDTEKAVVLDRHLPTSTGYFGPSQKQLTECGNLMAMTPKQWRSFIRNHPRTRPEYR